MTEFLPILLVPLARHVEALRDAIDFSKGAMPMGLLWHILKFPQFAFWVLAGYFGSFERIWIIIIALALAFVVFELSLRFYRKIDWRQYPWA